MKEIVLIAILIASTSFLELSAQHIKSFKRQLASQDILMGRGAARAEVNEIGDARQLIEYADTARAKPATINGYRVRIFFGNQQTARAEANEISDKFRSMFPTVPLYLNYENPYFKVTVGDCLTNEEAIVLWGRIKRYFDMAFVIREQISLEQLKNMGLVELKVEESSVQGTPQEEGTNETHTETKPTID